MNERLRQSWHRVSIYLPVLLLGLMALGTYWLVHTTPGSREAKTAAVLRHQPDYFMRGFSLIAYDAQGRIKSEVEGGEIRHYPDDDTLEIDHARIQAFSRDGKRATARAELARAKGDGSEVELIGDAFLIREALPSKARPEPPLEIRSQYLHVDRGAERIKSHRPVLLVRGGERITGDAFEYSDVDQVLELRGHVVMDLLPRSRK